MVRPNILILGLMFIRISAYYDNYGQRITDTCILLLTTCLTKFVYWLYSSTMLELTLIMLICFCKLKLSLNSAKRFKLTCAPIKDTYQPVLIRVFHGCSMGSHASNVFSDRKQRLIRLCIHK